MFTVTQKLDIKRLFTNLIPVKRKLPITSVAPDLKSSQDRERVTHAILECLNPEGGEITARRNVVVLGAMYLNLSEKGRAVFFDILQQRFSYDEQAICRAANHYLSTKGDNAYTALNTLSDVITTASYTLFKRFNSMDHGVQLLIEARHTIMQLNQQDQRFSSLLRDITKVLSLWFDVGMLDLKRITWDSPASLLEKVMHYEAVHKIRSWSDLKNRLDSDRLCFAFFHYRMPNEPLIFVETAFTKGVTTSMEALLSEEEPVTSIEETDTMMFYSISNTQRGLSGIHLGNFLLKRVIDEIKVHYPHITQFATLSPIPGLRKWIASLDEKEVSAILPAHQELQRLTQSSNLLDAMQKLINHQHYRWEQDGKVRDALRKPLLTLCARYLTSTQEESGRALDSVAHFHLSNGSSIASINWMADTSPKTMKNSLGMMVNYVYHTDRIDLHHEAYKKQGSIHYSKEVDLLLKNAKKT